MKLEDQVCSLSSASRLMDLGVKQESFYRWRIGCGDPWNPFVDRSPVAEQFSECGCKNYSAFTTDELSKMLPNGSDITHDETSRHGKYWASEGRQGSRTFWANTEADARAKCLIYLLEKGLVKP